MAEVRDIIYDDTRDKTYFVSLPLADYEKICQTVRDLLSMVYFPVGLLDDDEKAISDDDGFVISDTDMKLNPDESQRFKEKITSGELPYYIHKIAEGVDKS